MTTKQSAGLVAKWREFAEAKGNEAYRVGLTEAERNWHMARSQQADECADELEAALAAATAADGVIVPREIVENYAQSTLIPRHKRICEAALAALAAATAADGDWQTVPKTANGLLLDTIRTQLACDTGSAQGFWDKCLYWATAAPPPVDVSSRWREWLKTALQKWPEAEAALIATAGALGPLAEITQVDIDWAKDALLDGQQPEE